MQDGVRSRLTARLVASAVALGLAGASPAGAYVYWANANGPGPVLPRVNLDGTGANPNFITGVNSAQGVSVDSAHVYWGNNSFPPSIGRANLDGTGVNQNFIAVAGSPTGTGSVTGVAVDGAHVYWANPDTKV